MCGRVIQIKGRDKRSIDTREWVTADTGEG